MLLASPNNKYCQFFNQKTLFGSILFYFDFDMACYRSLHRNILVKLLQKRHFTVHFFKKEE